MQRIGVIGAGAWGTALAVAAQRAGRDVIIQAHEPAVAQAINESGENTTYFKGVALNPSIKATTDLSEVVKADAVLLVAPAQHLRAVCLAAKEHWQPGTPAVICAKGIEQGSAKLMSEAVSETLGDLAPIAVLSGPTFAIEVAKGCPTAVTLACADKIIGRALVEALGSERFRPYQSSDVIGAQLGGAVKNVLAIACGIVDGRGMGDNARAALITRGLAEIARLGDALGAQQKTLMGLSGLGDLTLTCNALQSRNFSLGVALGKGTTLEQILAERNSVAEGVFTASSVMELANKHGVDMPLCAATDRVLNHGADLKHTIADLLSRPLNPE